jgi:DNA-directed RNA polymerase specialized sigma24 family protein
MKPTDCGYYFLGSTAIAIWQQDDREGQDRMLVCLSTVYRQAWFERVIFNSSVLSDEALRDMAATVFLSTWEHFNAQGKAGKLSFDKLEYTSYLFTAFKGNYLKALQKELRRVEAEKAFGGHDAAAGSGLAADSFLPERTAKALSRLSADCRQLLLWKHVEGLSHDEIAHRKQIARSSSIKMVSRCGRRFMEIWREMITLTVVK